MYKDQRTEYRVRKIELAIIKTLTDEKDNSFIVHHGRFHLGMYHRCSTFRSPDRGKFRGVERQKICSVQRRNGGQLIQRMLTPASGLLQNVCKFPSGCSRSFAAYNYKVLRQRAKLTNLQHPGKTIFQDRNGAIWVGADDRLTVFQPAGMAGKTTRKALKDLKRGN